VIYLFICIFFQKHPIGTGSLRWYWEPRVGSIPFPMYNSRASFLRRRRASYENLRLSSSDIRAQRCKKPSTPGNGKTLHPGQSGERSSAKAEDGRECVRSCHGAQIRSSASSGRFQAAMCGTIASSHFPISFHNSRCVSCLFSCLRIGFLAAVFLFLSLSLSLSLFLQSPFLNSRSVCM
jgi:hypothetical protein